MPRGLPADIEHWADIKVVTVQNDFSGTAARMYSNK